MQERGADVEELLRLGFGACTLEAAVPEEAPVRVARQSSTACGRRPSTRGSPGGCSPSAGIDVELIEVTGSVEVAPRLGLADAIVDLVSSGNTLRTNGLRSLGALFASEAVLIGRHDGDGRGRRLAAILRSVVDARASRYLMLNAPADAVGARSASSSPARARRASCPLAEPGMVAVHALVPADDVWRLLPRLEEAGASSILLVPVERMLG